jgi:dihydropteroate synthase
MVAAQPLLWGVLNVTPDSFSDGGEFLESERAIAHAVAMAQAGASIIDVGGESTRPGAERVSAEVEASRVIPVIEELAALGLTLSIDTMNAQTAARAIQAGVSYVNDVSGGLADRDMLSVLADSSRDYVIMHWRGHSDTMQDQAHYTDVVSEVIAELDARVEAAIAAGVGPERIILDPGLGFAKNAEQNWALLHGIDQIVSRGHRVLVGASRKRFLGELLPPGHDVGDRDGVSSTLGALLAERGVWGLRVHNPALHRDALNVWQALSKGANRD